MQTLRIRASSVGELFDCGARFEAKHINGLWMPTNPKAQLGTSVHAGAEAYDNSILTNEPITMDDIHYVVSSTLRGNADSVDWSDYDIDEFEKIAWNLTDLYCKEIAPKMSYVAIEVKASDLTISDLNLTLTGSIDRIYKVDDEHFGVADLKTGGSIVAKDGTVNTLGYGMQLGVYELLAMNSLGYNITEPAKIIGLQTAKTQKGLRAAIGEVSCPSKNLVGDAEHPGILMTIARVMSSGLFLGNPKSNLCGEKFCPIYKTCTWRI